MRYSPSKKGFFSEDVNYPVLPDDLVNITDIEHMDALNTLNSGGSVTVVGGLLVITPVDPAAIATAQHKAALAQYRANIQSLLDKSDMVCLRCYKKGLPFPADWVEWDNYLRSEIRNDSADPTQPLPTKPAYPANT